MIWGENGSGKTSLLEAVHILSYGKSFKTSRHKELIKRDTKGMYKKARNNQIKNFTGIDSKYEKPNSPFMSLDTKEYSISDSIDLIYEKVFKLDT